MRIKSGTDDYEDNRLENTGGGRDLQWREEMMDVNFKAPVWSLERSIG